MITLIVTGKTGDVRGEALHKSKCFRAALRQVVTLVFYFLSCLASAADAIHPGYDSQPERFAGALPGPGCPADARVTGARSPGSTSRAYPPQPRNGANPSPHAATRSATGRCFYVAFPSIMRTLVVSVVTDLNPHQPIHSLLPYAGGRMSTERSPSRPERSPKVRSINLGSGASSR